MIRMPPLPRPNAAPARLLHIVRLSQISPCRPSPLVLSRAARGPLTRSFQTSSEKRADPGPSGTRRYPFPERLLIYHAGTARTIFLASLKITTIFIFGFFCFIMTPAYIMAPDISISRAVAVAGCGIVPVVFVTYSTTPIVTYVHIRVPVYARQSRDALQRWVRAGVSRETDLDFSSMTFLARPKQTTVKVGDVVATHHHWLGTANYTLRPGGTSAPGPLIRRGGKWWQSKPLKKFSVQGFNRDGREAWVWSEMCRQFERRAALLKGYEKDANKN